MVNNGCTVIFSTHRMEQVEEVCENIVLINEGKKIMEGSVEQIKDDFKENKYEVKVQGEFSCTLSDEITRVDATESGAIVYTATGVKPEIALRKILDQGNSVSSFQEILPSLDEIFIRTVHQKNQA